MPRFERRSSIKYTKYWTNGFLRFGREEKSLGLLEIGSKMRGNGGCTTVRASVEHTAHERGYRLRPTGRSTRQSQPVPGKSVFKVFSRSAMSKGIYENKILKGMCEMNSFLGSSLRTMNKND